tara:strand:+ start:26021 stop:26743 length:723 start_codon:yes stop_codon:yes gene_type:complete
VIYFFSFSLYANEVRELRLGAFKIPKFIEDNKSGNFIKLVQRIEKKIGKKFNILIRPPKRTYLSFNNNELFGYFPSLEVDKINDSYKSHPFYYKKDLFFRNINGVRSFRKAKRICLTRGYPYSKEIMERKGLSISYSESDESCLRMLQIGRVDGFICEAISGLSALSVLKFGNIVANEKPLSSIPVTFAFIKTKEGKKIAESFSKELRLMKKNGELNEIFKDVYKKIEKISDIRIDFLKP